MYKSIVVPLDGSAYAERALQHVVDHEKDASRLTLVKVGHTFDELVGKKQPEPGDSMEKTEDMLTREAYDEERGEDSRYMHKIQASLAGQPFEIKVVMAEGKPAEQILRIARDVDADLIAITSYGKSASKSPPKAGVFGRVADGLLKDANVPVLVVNAFEKS